VHLFVIVCSSKAHQEKCNNEALTHL
jgi:hypothetical protein